MMVVLISTELGCFLTPVLMELLAGRAPRETPSHAHAHSLHTPASRTASHDTSLHLSLTYTHHHAHHPADCNSRTHPPAHHSRHAPASVLDRLELGETPRRVELACQELGRSRWAAASLQVTNYEFERVAHTELHTPGLLATRCKKLPRLERDALGSRSRAGVTTLMRWRIHSNANASMAPEAEVGSSCRGDARHGVSGDARG